MSRSRWFASLCLVPFLLAAPAPAQSVELFREDFETGYDQWNVEGFWHLDVDTSSCIASTFPSGAHAMWYGRLHPDLDLCSYDGFLWQAPALRLRTQISLPASSASYLDFMSYSRVESDSYYDVRAVHVSIDSGASWQEVFRVGTYIEPWTLHTIDLSAFAGERIKLRFTFWTGDAQSNDFMGWVVDDVVIRTTSFPVSCLGDGSATACPCANSSSPADMAGCLNSLGKGGALRATGSASLSDDSVKLWGSDMPSTTVFYYQGASVLNGGMGIAAGDGLSCTGGPIRRLGTTTNENGVSAFPLPGGESLSVRGQITAPGTRWYQARYRNAVSFCTPDTFNSTNQVRVDWTP